MLPPRKSALVRTVGEEKVNTNGEKSKCFGSDARISKERELTELFLARIGGFYTGLQKLE